MQPIFIIVGPPAVGKSTTSRALATSFARGIHIPVDDLREMVVAGKQMPALEWSDALAEQVTLARTSAMAIARIYQQAGFAVVIDDLVDPRGLVEYRAFDTAHVMRVLLHCEQQVAHARNAQRAGDSPVREYIDIGIRAGFAIMGELHDQFARDGWQMIDASTASTAALVAEIRRRVG